MNVHILSPASEITTDGVSDHVMGTCLISFSKFGSPSVTMRHPFPIDIGSNNNEDVNIFVLIRFILSQYFNRVCSD